MELPTLKELVELIPRIPVLIVLLFIAALFIAAYFFNEDVTQAEQDMHNLVNIAQGLADGSRDQVPLLMYKENHYYVAYKEEYENLPVSCEKQHCLCVSKEGGDTPIDCEPTGDILITFSTPDLDLGKGNTDLLLERKGNIVAVTSLGKI